jgi:hypothetical protein
MSRFARPSPHALKLRRHDFEMPRRREDLPGMKLGERAQEEGIEILTQHGLNFRGRDPSVMAAPGL